MADIVELERAQHTEVAGWAHDVAQFGIFERASAPCLRERNEMCFIGEDSSSNGGGGSGGTSCGGGANSDEDDEDEMWQKLPIITFQTFDDLTG